MYLIKYGEIEFESLILSVKPDIVFLDIKLPGASGLQIYEKLRASGFKNPIIAQTSSATSLEIDVYTEIFQNGVISKPIEENRVLALLIQYKLIDFGLISDREV